MPPARTSPYDMPLRGADDLGYNNIGHHNHHVTLSPHIDALFEQGLELNHSFSHKWCAPTR